MKKTKKNKTAGQISSELIQKSPETFDPIEQTAENLSDYEKSVIECVDLGRKKSPNDFFVVVLTKREPLMPNIIRNYFVSRVSCPTPNYDQIVYKYYQKDDRLDLLWCVPDKETCEVFRVNALHVVEEEKQLLHWILDFYSGELDKLCKKLNKEVGPSPIIERIENPDIIIKP